MKVLLSAILIYGVSAIAFQLSETRQTCLYIKKRGTYEMEYIISGENPNLYTCTIYSDSNIIQNITTQTQYQKIIEFVSDNNNKVCFSALDSLPKQVSFDIMSAQDPLKDHFSVKEQEETHLKMFAAFQSLQKVYRDQHMFIERNILYQNVLMNKQIKIIFILLFKILIAIILGAYQLMLIKEIVSSKMSGYKLPAGVQQGEQSDQQIDL